jgi:hypothetical protein
MLQRSENEGVNAEKTTWHNLRRISSFQKNYFCQVVDTQARRNIKAVFSIVRRNQQVNG